MEDTIRMINKNISVAISIINMGGYMFIKRFRQ